VCREIYCGLRGIFAVRVEVDLWVFGVGRRGTEHEGRERMFAGLKRGRLDLGRRGLAG
jgi:hypothetical protein